MLYFWLVKKIIERLEDEHRSDRCYINNFQSVIIQSDPLRVNTKQFVLSEIGYYNKLSVNNKLPSCEHQLWLKIKT